MIYSDFELWLDTEGAVTCPHCDSKMNPVERGDIYGSLYSIDSDTKVECPMCKKAFRLWINTETRYRTY